MNVGEVGIVKQLTELPRSIGTQDGASIPVRRRRRIVIYYVRWDLPTDGMVMEQ